jgi:endonuclease/exonuclease/phosphatase family metal-dependent hydrolase
MVIIRIIRKYRLSGIFLMLSLCGAAGCCRSQTPDRQANRIRMMFYNVENFFDTDDDPSVNDSQYLPEGAMHWSFYRYAAKRDAIFRVIAGVGEWEPPALVALCEIENRKVLDNLITNTPLKKFPYRVVHRESPDIRGIDAALLYRGDRLKCIGQEFIRIRFPDNRKRTRDIVYATMLAGDRDTLHVFVNHWPSRSGGQRKSDPARILAATVLRGKVDSIFAANRRANILITGDLNDGPANSSVLHHLNALADTAQSKDANLFNLSAYKTREDIGTLKYQGKWSVFDQIIVSGSMLCNGNRMKTTAAHCRIFSPDFLFEPDMRYGGKKPFRTYIGQKYNNGFSDHLPVFLDIFLTN